MSAAEPLPAEPLPEREFDGTLPRTFLRPALLVLLAQGPSHGYDFLVDLHDAGLRSLDLAGLYRGLRAMEREGVVASVWEPSDVGPPRRVYELTSSGRVATDDAVDGLRAARRNLERLLADSPVTSGPR